jgi:transcription initiation factor IIE alpha subunit
MLETQYNPSDIIYGTLNPQIIKLYYVLFPSESTYVIKKLLNIIFKSENLKFNFSEMIEPSHFTLDDDLIQYLTKIYSDQLNEPLNKQIELTIKKLEKEAGKLTNFEEYYIDTFKKIHYNILQRDTF